MYCDFTALLLHPASGNMCTNMAGLEAFTMNLAAMTTAYRKEPLPYV